MALDADRMYQAMVSRNRRFEGQFVVGVRTTGVYCRPGCPARIPLRHNVRFYACTAAAQADGLRPCLRCRPDAAPGSPAAIGTPTTVVRALRLIAQGALDEAGVDALGDRLGVTSRHLRRLFERHLGASPLVVARTQRVHFARKLLEETSMTMTEVAGAAGFASLRRFNDAVRGAFQATPSELRRRSTGRGAAAAAAGDAPDAPAPGALRLSLPVREPFAYAELLAFLGARAIPGVESVSRGTYARTIASGSDGGFIVLSRDGGGGAVRLTVTAESTRRPVRHRRPGARSSRSGRRPRADRGAPRRDPLLAAAVRARPGLRVPGAWDGFELAMRAILGQQVTVPGATTLAGRLVARFGVPVRDARPGLTHLFPSPEALAIADIASIGLPRARAAAIQSLARAASSGQRPYESADAMIALDGVGPWTAAYVAMRAGRDPDAFPAGDLGLRRAATRAGEPSPSAQALEAMAEPWRPWRAYAALHLWTKGVTT